MEQFDVIIIGAGVTGCAIARFLSRYDLKVAVLEKEEDVCSGTSKANSGIVHAGFDAAPGSMMAKMNVRGCAMVRELSKTLHFSYRNNGSMVLCFDEAQKSALEALCQKGVQNGVEGLKILSGDKAREMEPHLSDKVVAALYAPSSGVVCPFSMTVAFAENACANGVKFYFLTEVTGICKTDSGFILNTSRGDYQTRFVVNAAGVYADAFHNLVSENKIHITPRRGEYVLMDKEVGDLVDRTIFQLPGKFGKGVLVTPTAHGKSLSRPQRARFRR